MHTLKFGNWNFLSHVIRNFLVTTSTPQLQVTILVGTKTRYDCNYQRACRRIQTRILVFDRIFFIPHPISTHVFPEVNSPITSQQMLRHATNEMLSQAMQGNIKSRCTRNIKSLRPLNIKSGHPLNVVSDYRLLHIKSSY